MALGPFLIQESDPAQPTSQPGNEVRYAVCATPALQGVLPPPPPCPAPPHLRSCGHVALRHPPVNHHLGPLPVHRAQLHALELVVYAEEVADGEHGEEAQRDNDARTLVVAHQGHGA